MCRYCYQIKKSIIDGFFVTLPILLLLLILDETISFISEVMSPLAEKVPGRELLGVDLATWLALLLVIILFWIVGSIAATRFGKSVGDWTDRSILGHIPGYTLVKSISKQFSGKSEEVLLSPALFSTDKISWRYAFILEEFDDKYYSIFVPISPTVMAGSVHYILKDYVKKLDIPPSKVIDCLMKWGIDSKKMINIDSYLRD